MDAAVQFNVGGKHYEVAKSLLAQFPNTMLARVSSSTWNPPVFGAAESGTTPCYSTATTTTTTTTTEATTSAAPIFLEADGERFRYVLDYMRHGRVDLPLSESKPAFLREMAFFGFENVDLDAIDGSSATTEAVSHMINIEEQNKVQLKEFAKALLDVEEQRKRMLKQYAQVARTLEVKKLCTEFAYLLLQKFEKGDSMSNYEFNQYETALAQPDLLNRCLSKYGLRLIDRVREVVNAVLFNRSSIAVRHTLVIRFTSANSSATNIGRQGATNSF